MKKLLLSLALLSLIGGTVAYRLYHKPHQDLNKTRPEFRVSSIDLFEAFDLDEAAANRKYLDKIVEVTGTIQEIRRDEQGKVNIVLNAGSMMGGVLGELAQVYAPGAITAEPGEIITLRGICSGFLMDVVLVRCIITGS